MSIEVRSFYFDFEKVRQMGWPKAEALASTIFFFFFFVHKFFFISYISFGYVSPNPKHHHENKKQK